MRCKQSSWVRLILLITLQIFAWEQVAWAAPSGRSIFSGKTVNHNAIRQRNLELLEQRQQVHEGRPQTSDLRPQTSDHTPAAPLSLAALADLSALHLPAEDGQVLEAWAPDEREAHLVKREAADPRFTNDERRFTVVLLQDLHTQPQAQRAEARILEHLAQAYDVRAIASEGASTPIDVSFPRRFPQNAHLRDLVAETFLEAGELTAEEYVAITKPYPLAIHGVEDETLYTENLTTYHQVMAIADRAQQSLDSLQAACERLKPAIYGKAIRDLDVQREAFAKGERSMPDYLAMLAQQAQAAGVSLADLAPNLARLQALQAQEQTLNQTAAEEQLRLLLTGLSQALADGAKPQLADELQTLTARFQQRQIAPVSFYRQLLDVSSRVPIALEPYPDLVRLADYLVNAQALQAHRIHPELAVLEEALEDRLARNDQERTLARLSRQADFLNDFFHLKLTNDQVAYFRAHRDQFRAATFTQFLTPLVQKHHRDVYLDLSPALIDDQLATLDSFYTVAQQRDQALVSNTLALLTNAGQGTRDKGQKAESSRQEAEAQAVNAERPSSLPGSPQSTGATRGHFVGWNVPRPPRTGQAVVLVAGGFHTAGMTALLRERGVRYVVISPNATDALDEERYRRLLAGDRLDPISFVQLAGRLKKPPVRTAALLRVREMFAQANISVANANWLVNAVALAAARMPGSLASLEAQLRQEHGLTELVLLGDPTHQGEYVLRMPAQLLQQDDTEHVALRLGANGALAWVNAAGFQTLEVARAKTVIGSEALHETFDQHVASNDVTRIALADVDGGQEGLDEVEALLEAVGIEQDLAIHRAKEALGDDVGGYVFVENKAGVNYAWDRASHQGSAQDNPDAQYGTTWLTPLAREDFAARIIYEMGALHGGEATAQDFVALLQAWRAWRQAGSVEQFQPPVNLARLVPMTNAQLRDFAGRDHAMPAGNVMDSLGAARSEGSERVAAVTDLLQKLQGIEEDSGVMSHYKRLGTQAQAILRFLKDVPEKWEGYFYHIVSREFRRRLGVFVKAYGQRNVQKAVAKKAEQAIGIVSTNLRLALLQEAVKALGWQQYGSVQEALQAIADRIDILQPFVTSLIELLLPDGRIELVNCAANAVSSVLDIDDVGKKRGVMAAIRLADFIQADFMYEGNVAQARWFVAGESSMFTVYRMLQMARYFAYRIGRGNRQTLQELAAIKPRTLIAQFELVVEGKTHRHIARIIMQDGALGFLDADGKFQALPESLNRFVIITDGDAALDPVTLSEQFAATGAMTLRSAAPAIDIQTVSRAIDEQRPIELGREANYAEKKNRWIFAHRRLEELAELDPSDKAIERRKDEAYQKALQQAGDLGKLALHRGLIVLCDGISKGLPVQFALMMARDAMSKFTSNGVLIAQTFEAYKGEIEQAIIGGDWERSVEDLYNLVFVQGLVGEGVRAMDPAHQAGEPAGGSIEIRSHLTDVKQMVEEAKKLAGLVGGEDFRHVAINKIPAIGKVNDNGVFEGPGIQAIEDAIAEGLFPNVTLVFFSLAQIKAVAGAIARGLARRIQRLREDGATDEQIAGELLRFKSFISYFFSRLAGPIATDQEFAREVAGELDDLEVLDHKLAFADLVMDLPVAFFVSGHEVFKAELQRVGNEALDGFGDLLLKLNSTTELDASTGEKAFKANSPLIRAFTEQGVGIEELAKRVPIEGYEAKYERIGYFVVRAAREGSADTIPIGLYNTFVRGEAAGTIQNVRPMTLDEARAVLQRAQGLGLTQEKWEQYSARLLREGVESFIKAEQGLRVKILEVLVETAIKHQQYEYAERQVAAVEKVLNQIAESHGEGVVNDFQTTVAELKQRVAAGSAVRKDAWMPSAFRADPLVVSAQEKIRDLEAWVEATVGISESDAIFSPAAASAYRDRIQELSGDTPLSPEIEHQINALWMMGRLLYELRGMLESGQFKRSSNAERQARAVLQRLLAPEPGTLLKNAMVAEAFVEAHKPDGLIRQLSTTDLGGGKASSFRQRLVTTLISDETAVSEFLLPEHAREYCHAAGVASEFLSRRRGVILESTARSRTWLAKVFRSPSDGTLPFRWKVLYGVTLSVALALVLAGLADSEVAAAAAFAPMTAMADLWSSKVLPASDGIAQQLQARWSDTKKIIASHSGTRVNHGETAEPSAEDLLIAATYGYEYALQRIEALGPKRSKTHFRIALAMDSRPSGPAFREAFIRGMLTAAEDRMVTFEVLDFDVVPKPFAQSAVQWWRDDGSLDGLIYITASHNPINWNGWELSTSNHEPKGGDWASKVQGGALLDSETAGRAIDRVSARIKGLSSDVAAKAFIRQLGEVQGGVSSENALVRRVNAEVLLDGYIEQAGKFLGFRDEQGRPLNAEQLVELRQKASEVAVVLDVNGGAATTFYAEALRHFGFNVVEINNEREHWSHASEPVGDALNDAIAEAEKIGRSGRANGKPVKSVIFVVVDCDADRGKVGAFDEAIGKAVAFESQESGMMLLKMAAELDHLRHGQQERAVVINDASGSRVLQTLGESADVATVEVGEVNLVAVAQAIQEGRYFSWSFGGYWAAQWGKEKYAEWLRTVAEALQQGGFGDLVPTGIEHARRGGFVLSEAAARHLSRQQWRNPAGVTVPTWGRRPAAVPGSSEASNGGTLLGDDATCRDGCRVALLAGFSLVFRDLLFFGGTAQAWSKSRSPNSLVGLVEQMAGERAIRPKMRQTTVLGKWEEFQRFRDDPGTFKRRAEEYFERQGWEGLRSAFGYESYEYEYSNSTTVMRFSLDDPERPRGSIHSKGGGGWKIVLKRPDMTEVFIWVRGSATEPIARWMVDGARTQEEFDALQEVLARSFGRSPETAPEAAVSRAVTSETAEGLLNALLPVPDRAAVLEAIRDGDLSKLEYFRRDVGQAEWLPVQSVERQQQEGRPDQLAITVVSKGEPLTVHSLNSMVDGEIPLTRTLDFEVGLSRIRLQRSDEEQQAAVQRQATALLDFLKGLGWGAGAAVPAGLSVTGKQAQRLAKLAKQETLDPVEQAEISAIVGDVAEVLSRALSVPDIRLSDLRGILQAERQSQNFQRGLLRVARVAYIGLGVVGAVAAFVLVGMQGDALSVSDRLARTLGISVGFFGILSLTGLLFGRLGVLEKEHTAEVAISTWFDKGSSYVSWLLPEQRQALITELVNHPSRIAARLLTHLLEKDPALLPDVIEELEDGTDESVDWRSDYAAFLAPALCRAYEQQELATLDQPTKERQLEAIAGYDTPEVAEFLFNLLEQEQDLALTETIRSLFAAEGWSTIHSTRQAQRIAARGLAVAKAKLAIQRVGELAGQELLPKQLRPKQVKVIVEAARAVTELLGVEPKLNLRGFIESAFQRGSRLDLASPFAQQLLELLAPNAKYLAPNCMCQLAAAFYRRSSYRDFGQEAMRVVKLTDWFTALVTADDHLIQDLRDGKNSAFALIPMLDEHVGRGWGAGLASREKILEYAVPLEDPDARGPPGIRTGDVLAKFAINDIAHLALVRRYNGQLYYADLTDDGNVIRWVALPDDISEFEIITTSTRLLPKASRYSYPGQIALTAACGILSGPKTMAAMFWLAYRGSDNAGLLLFDEQGARAAKVTGPPSVLVMGIQLYGMGHLDPSIGFLDAGGGTVLDEATRQALVRFKQGEPLSDRDRRLLHARWRNQTAGQSTSVERAMADESLALLQDEGLGRMSPRSNTNPLSMLYRRDEEGGVLKTGGWFDMTHAIRLGHQGNSRVGRWYRISQFPGVKELVDRVEARHDLYDEQMKVLLQAELFDMVMEKAGRGPDRQKVAEPGVQDSYEEMVKLLRKEKIEQPPAHVRPSDTLTLGQARWYLDSYASVIDRILTGVRMTRDERMQMGVELASEEWAKWEAVWRLLSDPEAGAHVKVAAHFARESVHHLFRVQGRLVGMLNVHPQWRAEVEALFLEKLKANFDRHPPEQPVSWFDAWKRERAVSLYGTAAAALTEWVQRRLVQNGQMSEGLFTQYGLEWGVFDPVTLEHLWFVDTEDAHDRWATEGDRSRQNGQPLTDTGLLARLRDGVRNLISESSESEGDLGARRPDAGALESGLLSSLSGGELQALVQGDPARFADRLASFFLKHPGKRGSPQRGLFHNGDLDGTVRTLVDQLLFGGDIKAVRDDPGRLRGNGYMPVAPNDLPILTDTWRLIAFQEYLYDAVRKDIQLGLLSDDLKYQSEAEASGYMPQALKHYWNQIMATTGSLGRPVHQDEAALRLALMVFSRLDVAKALFGDKVKSLTSEIAIGFMSNYGELGERTFVSHKRNLYIAVDQQGRYMVSSDERSALNMFDRDKVQQAIQDNRRYVQQANAAIATLDQQLKQGSTSDAAHRQAVAQVNNKLEFQQGELRNRFKLAKLISLKGSEKYVRITRRFNAESGKSDVEFEFTDLEGKLLDAATDAGIKIEPDKGVDIDIADKGGSRTFGEKEIAEIPSVVRRSQVNYIKRDEQQTLFLEMGSRSVLTRELIGEEVGLLKEFVESFPDEGNIRSAAEESARRVLLGERHGWNMDRLYEAFGVRSDTSPIEAIRQQRNIGKLKTIVIVGTGSSKNDADATAALYRKLLPGIRVITVGPARMLLTGMFLKRESTLVMGISWSGSTANTSLFLHWMKSRGFLVGALTGNPDSDIGKLTKDSAGTVHVRTGQEVAIYTTKGFAGILYDLYLSAVCLSQLYTPTLDEAARERVATLRQHLLTELDRMPHTLADHLKREALDLNRDDSTVNQAGELFKRANSAIIIGSLHDNPIINEIALKIGEVRNIEHKGYDFADDRIFNYIRQDDRSEERPLVFINATDLRRMGEARYVLQEMLKLGQSVIVQTVEGIAEQEWFEDLSKRYNGQGASKGLPVALVTYVPRVDSSLQALVDAMFGFRFSVAVARAAGLSDEAIDQPRNLAKSVTVTSLAVIGALLSLSEFVTTYKTKIGEIRQRFEGYLSENRASMSAPMQSLFQVPALVETIQRPRQPDEFGKTHDADFLQHESRRAAWKARLQATFGPALSDPKRGLQRVVFLVDDSNAEAAAAIAELQIVSYEAPQAEEIFKRSEGVQIVINGRLYMARFDEKESQIVVWHDTEEKRIAVKVTSDSKGNIERAQLAGGQPASIEINRKRYQITVEEKVGLMLQAEQPDMLGLEAVVHRPTDQDLLDDVDEHTLVVALSRFSDFREAEREMVLVSDLKPREITEMEPPEPTPLGPSPPRWVFWQWNPNRRGSYAYRAAEFRRLHRARSTYFGRLRAVEDLRKHFVELHAAFGEHHRKGASLRGKDPLVSMRSALSSIQHHYERLYEVMRQEKRLVAGQQVYVPIVTVTDEQSVLVGAGMSNMGWINLGNQDAYGIVAAYASALLRLGADLGQLRGIRSAVAYLSGVGGVAPALMRETLLTYAPGSDRQQQILRFFRALASNDYHRGYDTINVIGGASDDPVTKIYENAFARVGIKASGLAVDESVHGPLAEVHDDPNKFADPVLKQGVNSHYDPNNQEDLTQKDVLTIILATDPRAYNPALIDKARTRVRSGRVILIVNQGDYNREEIQQSGADLILALPDAPNELNAFDHMMLAPIMAEAAGQALEEARALDARPGEFGVQVTPDGRIVGTTHLFNEFLLEQPSQLEFARSAVVKGTKQVDGVTVVEFNRQGERRIVDRPQALAVVASVVGLMVVYGVLRLLGIDTGSEMLAMVPMLLRKGEQPLEGSRGEEDERRSLDTSGRTEDPAPDLGTGGKGTEAQRAAVLGGVGRVDTGETLGTSAYTTTQQDAEGTAIFTETRTRNIGAPADGALVARELPEGKLGRILLVGWQSASTGTKKRFEKAGFEVVEMQTGDPELAEDQIAQTLAREGIDLIVTASSVDKDRPVGGEKGLSHFVDVLLRSRANVPAVLIGNPREEEKSPAGSVWVRRARQALQGAVKLARAGALSAGTLMAEGTREIWFDGEDFRRTSVRGGKRYVGNREVGRDARGEYATLDQLMVLGDSDPLNVDKPDGGKFTVDDLRMARGAARKALDGFAEKFAVLMGMDANRARRLLRGALPVRFIEFAPGVVEEDGSLNMRGSRTFATRVGPQALTSAKGFLTNPFLAAAASIHELVAKYGEADERAGSRLLHLRAAKAEAAFIGWLLRKDEASLGTRIGVGQKAALTRRLRELDKELAELPAAEAEATKRDQGRFDSADFWQRLSALFQEVGTLEVGRQYTFVRAGLRLTVSATQEEDSELVKMQLQVRDLKERFDIPWSIPLPFDSYVVVPEKRRGGIVQRALQSFKISSEGKAESSWISGQPNFTLWLIPSDLSRADLLSEDMTGLSPTVPNPYWSVTRQGIGSGGEVSLFLNGLYIPPTLTKPENLASAESRKIFLKYPVRGKAEAYVTLHWDTYRSAEGGAYRALRVGVSEELFRSAKAQDGRSIVVTDSEGKVVSRGRLVFTPTEAARGQEASLWVVFEGSAVAQPADQEGIWIWLADKASAPARLPSDADVTTAAPMGPLAGKQVLVVDATPVLVRAGVGWSWARKLALLEFQKRGGALTIFAKDIAAAQQKVRSDQFDALVLVIDPAADTRLRGNLPLDDQGFYALYNHYIGQVRQWYSGPVVFVIEGGKPEHLTQNLRREGVAAVLSSDVFGSEPGKGSGETLQQLSEAITRLTLAREAAGAVAGQFMGADTSPATVAELGEVAALRTYAEQHPDDAKSIAEALDAETWRVRVAEHQSELWAWVQKHAQLLFGVTLGLAFLVLVGASPEAIAPAMALPLAGGQVLGGHEVIEETADGYLRTTSGALVHRDARVHENAVIVGGQVMSGAVVEGGAYVERSLVHSGAVVRSSAMIIGAEIGTRAGIGAHATVETNENLRGSYEYAPGLVGKGPEPYWVALADGNQLTVGTRVRRGARVQERAIVRNADIGPNGTVTGGEVRNSTFGENAAIAHARVFNVTAGRDVKIPGTEQLPLEVTNAVIGDGYVAGVQGLEDAAWYPNAIPIFEYTDGELQVVDVIKDVPVVVVRDRQNIDSEYAGLLKLKVEEGVVEEVTLPDERKGKALKRIDGTGSSLHSWFLWQTLSIFAPFTRLIGIQSPKGPTGDIRVDAINPNLTMSMPFSVIGFDPAGKTVAPDAWAATPSFALRTGLGRDEVHHAWVLDYAPDVVFRLMAMLAERAPERAARGDFDGLPEQMIRNAIAYTQWQLGELLQEIEKKGSSPKLQALLGRYERGIAAYQRHLDSGAWKFKACEPIGWTKTEQGWQHPALDLGTVARAQGLFPSLPYQQVTFDEIFAVQPPGVPFDRFPNYPEVFVKADDISRLNKPQTGSRPASLMLDPSVVVHPTAVIEEGALIGENVVIGAGVTIRQTATLEDGARIMGGSEVAGWVGSDAFVSGSVVDSGSKIGNGSRVIGSTLAVAKVGRNVSLINSVVLGYSQDQQGIIIGNGVQLTASKIAWFYSAHPMAQQTRIGAGTRGDHVYVLNSEIGKDVLLEPYAAIIEDVVDDGVKAASTRGIGAFLRHSNVSGLFTMHHMATRVDGYTVEGMTYTGRDGREHVTPVVPNIGGGSFLRGEIHELVGSFWSSITVVDGHVEIGPFCYTAAQLLDGEFLPALTRSEGPGPKAKTLAGMLAANRLGMVFRAFLDKLWLATPPEEREHIGLFMPQLIHNTRLAFEQELELRRTSERSDPAWGRYTTEQLEAGLKLLVEHDDGRWAQDANGNFVNGYWFTPNDGATYEWVPKTRTLVDTVDLAAIPVDDPDGARARLRNLAEEDAVLLSIDAGSLETGGAVPGVLFVVHQDVAQGADMDVRQWLARQEHIVHNDSNMPQTVARIYQAFEQRRVVFFIGPFGEDMQLELSLTETEFEALLIAQTISGTLRLDDLFAQIRGKFTPEALRTAQDILAAK